MILALLTGCMGKSKPARFYTLTPVYESGTVMKEKSFESGLAVGIGPVKIADYLNQSRIVTRTAGNRIRQAEFDQWTGSLQDNLVRTLAENLGFLLATDHVFIYPWRSFVPVDCQVMVDIVRFDGGLGKEVVLVARWSVLTGERDKKLATVQRSEIHEKTGGEGYAEFVAAQSRALAGLSREIAAEIEEAVLKTGT
jgi:hypothetical protein